MERWHSLMLLSLPDSETGGTQGMSEPERESLEMDVLFVGAGPASLAGAYHLEKRIESHNAANSEHPIEASIAVLEKGQEIGGHALSGAVVDPRALKELYPREWRDAPLEAEVAEEKLLFLTKNNAWPMPIPPMMENEGISGDAILDP